MTKEQLRQCNRLVKKAAVESFAVGSFASKRFKIERILLMNIQKRMVFGIVEILGKELNHEQVCDVLWNLLITKTIGVNSFFATAPLIFEDQGFKGSVCREYTRQLGEAVIRLFDDPATDGLDYYFLGRCVNLNTSPYPVVN